MSDRERYGTRGLEYSAWHRTESIARFIDRSDAFSCAMIDVDALEYDRDTWSPLLAIETARDVGQSHKNSKVTAKLAEMFGGVALTVLYELEDHDNPEAPGVRDIKRFRVNVCHPRKDNEWKVFTPKKYAERLIKARKRQLLRLACGEG